MNFFTDLKTELGAFYLPQAQYEGYAIITFKANDTHFSLEA